MGHERLADAERPESVIDRIAMVLYQSGYRGRSATDFQWVRDGGWYREIAQKVYDVTLTESGANPTKVPS